MIGLCSEYIEPINDEYIEYIKPLNFQNQTLSRNMINTYNTPGQIVLYKEPNILILFN